MTNDSLFLKLFSRLPVKLPNQQQGARPPEPPPVHVPSLKLIFFITNWHHANIVSNVFMEEKVRFHFICKGRGTASSEVLDLLGIGADDKAVIGCLEQAVGVPVLMKEVRKILKPYAPTGAGISFTVPLSAINDPILLIFKQSIHKNEKISALNAAAKDSGEGTPAANEFSHAVIFSIVNQGYSDELMITARAAGAIGGTIINARGQAHEGAVKFFGVLVQDEKEIVIILVSREQKVPIMQAICDAHGLDSDAHGIVFSMPVDDVLGLSFD